VLILPHSDGRIDDYQVTRVVRRLAELPPSLMRVIVTHHPFDLPPGVHERRLLKRGALAMARLAAANADLFLSGHLHISHVSHVADRYQVAGHSGLIVQAGTVSTRGRGEAPSFNVLRLHRPEISVSRHFWSDTTGGFTPGAPDRFVHGPNGWRRSGLAAAS
jgi:3',5'-cyclic AMP phosphodiesterase CpdA